MRVLYLLYLCLILHIPFLPLSVIAIPTKPDTGPAVNHHIADKIEALCLYSIENGHINVHVFSGDELKARSAIRIKGYITGVVLLSISFIDATIAGHSLNQLQISNKGSCQQTGYNLEPEAFAAAFRDAGRPGFIAEHMNQFAGRYGWFPAVRGDAVCTQKQFTIVLKNSEQMLKVPVYHTGSIQLPVFSSKPDSAGNLMNFRYLGNDPGQFEIHDFEIRTRAIIDGIRSVETTMKNDLVTAVNLIDYYGVNNALTSEGRTEIWIYTETFWKESPEELHVIARHETIHILVDRHRLTKNTELRKMFADLRGLDPFSLERFTLITRGVLPPGAYPGENGAPDHILFAFINEMNFFKGMKGGHSRDNLDEFCVSFLHTLLYSENLGPNLQSPVILPGGGIRELNAKERSALLEDYLLVMEKMMNAVNKNPSNRIIKDFFRDRLENIRQLKERTA